MADVITDMTLTELQKEMEQIEEEEIAHAMMQWRRLKRAQKNAKASGIQPMIYQGFEKQMVTNVFRRSATLMMKEQGD